MRKLIILKTLIDVFWITSLITIPFMLILPFLNIESSSTFKINGVEIIANDIISRGLMLLLFVSYFMVLYCIYLFRKILFHFLKLNIFDAVVSIYFKRIGLLLIISAVLVGFSKISYQVLKLKSISINIGLTPFYLLLCLGLFFMVLGEIFKIAKSFKEENELTV